MPRSKKTITIQPGDLVAIVEAPSVFGAGWSRRSILRRIDSGEFKEGVHWIDEAPVGSRHRRIKLVKPEIEAHLSIPAGAR
ncbi:MAG: hypothetical protein RLZZ511_4115 [Cyanobacteriota bacterium]